MNFKKSAKLGDQTVHQVVAKMPHLVYFGEFAKVEIDLVDKLEMWMILLECTILIIFV